MCETFETAFEQLELEYFCVHNYTISSRNFQTGQVGGLSRAASRRMRCGERVGRAHERRRRVEAILWEARYRAGCRATSVSSKCISNRNY